VPAPAARDGETLMELAYLVGLLLVLIALATVVVMFWAILREPHEHQEHFIPPGNEGAETLPGTEVRTEP
jgi:hypothetical protein